MKMGTQLSSWQSPSLQTKILLEQEHQANLERLETLPIQFRLFNEANDLNYLLSSWMKSDRDNADNKYIPSQIYYPEREIIIRHLLNCSTIMIAHLDETPEMIVSYIVYQYLKSGLVIHYAYTGPRFRNQGIQTKLLHEINLLQQDIIITTKPDSKSLHTHLTYRYQVIFNPFLRR